MKYDEPFAPHVNPRDARYLNLARRLRDRRLAATLAELGLRAGEHAPAKKRERGATVTTTVTTTVKDIPREKLTPGQFQNRDLFEEQRLAELAASIKESGIIHPLLVRPDTDKKGHYRIVDGERRWRAAERAGLATVPCIIRDLDDAAHAEATVVANLQRENLTPIEEARGFGALRDVAGYSPAEIAQKVGRSAEYVKDSLLLLTLPENATEYAHTGTTVTPKNGDAPYVVKLSRAQAVALAGHVERFGPDLVAEMARQAVATGHPAATIAKDPQRVIEAYARDQRDDDGGPKPGARAFALPSGGGPFYESHCARCPFGARLGDKGQYGYGTILCLRPAHYRELHDRKRAEDDRANQKRIDEAKAKLKAKGADTTLPLLSSFEYDTFVEMDSYEGRGKAVACGDECPCRCVALKGDGTPVVICKDKKRFTSLKAKETRAIKKDRRADAKEKQGFVTAEIDRLAGTPTGYDERTVRLLAETALQTLTSSTKKLTDAGRHILPYLNRDTLFPDDSGQYYSMDRRLGDLSVVPTPALVRFAAEALALADINGYAETGGGLAVARRFLPAEEPEPAPEGAETPASPAEAASEIDAGEGAFVSDPDLVPGVVISGTPEMMAGLRARAAAAPVPDTGTADPDPLPPGKPERQWDRLGDTPDPAYKSSRRDDNGFVVSPLRSAEKVRELTAEDLGLTPAPAIAADVTAACARQDWAYETLAQHGREPSDFVVLHRAPSGDLLAFDQDAVYLMSNYGVGGEDAPDGVECARVGKRDADRIVEAITRAEGFTVAIIPAEGPAIVTVEPPDEDADDDDDEGDEPTGDLSLDEQLAAIDAL